jgi:outer membrane immunogenic protein
MRLSRYLGGVVSVAAAAVLAGTSLTSAADLGGGSYKDPIYQPPVVQSDIWTGFYFGGQGGIGVGNADSTLQQQAGPPPWVNFGPVFDDSTNLSGGVAGVYGGYNWQIGQTVLGLEGDWTWSDADGTTSCTNFNITCKKELDWTASLVARAGYAVGNSLWYVKGGAVWGDVGTRVRQNVVNGFRASDSETSFGWTVGMGLEHAFTRNFVVRVDYSYMDLGSETFFLRDPAFSPNFRVRSDVDTTVNQIKVGAAFKF